MSEIEKLYENAGIKKDLPINLADLDFSEEDCDELCLDNSCDECRYKTYPPFTAEKQLELIKWLSQHTYRNYIKFRFDICGLWYCECNMSNSDMHHTFEDALAQMINILWQDLPSEEKAEIKDILCE